MLTELEKVLLEALKVAEMAAQELCNDQHPENECWNSLRTIQAAIAKAEREL